MLNLLVGEHLSIVSRKAQTTRERIPGILTSDDFQILFIDAPGLIEPRYPLQEAMRLAASAAIDEADVIIFVADATKRDTLPTVDVLEAIRARSVPLLVAINKSDVAGEAGSGIPRELEAAGFDVLAVSALTGEGTAELIDWVVARLPASPPIFPIDDVATQSVRFFAEEYVRETCMELFRDEIPYSVACRVEEYREEGDPVYIRIRIYVERESQKGIVIGQAGSAIRQVGELSRAKIERLIGRQVYLELRVKVMADWSRKRARLRQLGYQMPPESRGGQNRS